MKRLFVSNHTILQIDVSILLDSLVTNPPSVKMMCPYKHTICQNVVAKKNCLTLYFCKNKTCLSDGVWRIGQIFSVVCKTVYLWVTTLLFHERCVSSQVWTRNIVVELLAFLTGFCFLWLCRHARQFPALLLSVTQQLITGKVIQTNRLTAFEALWFKLSSI
jgi:hypothetical protein